jgi:uncharacterized protein (DUF2249 family)
MISINANTRISEVLKGHPAALDTIIGISPLFARLRNPFQRKLMAGRTSIATASRMAGCTVNEFFARLERLGFVIEEGKTEKGKKSGPSGKISAIPPFLQNLGPDQVTELDVRPVIEKGSDPLSIILAKVKTLQTGKVLKIVNTFEPAPLIILLENRGFQSWSETIEKDLVYTYFIPPDSFVPDLQVAPPPAADDWEEVMESFAGKLTTIDVRSLEMPMPMLTIVGALDNLGGGDALFVHHKRIPVFLLPELAERGFEYRIRNIDEENVKLLIFKSGSN